MAAPNSQRGLFWPNFPQPGAQKWSLFASKKKALARSKSPFSLYFSSGKWANHHRDVASVGNKVVSWRFACVNTAYGLYLSCLDQVLLSVVACMLQPWLQHERGKYQSDGGAVTRCRSGNAQTCISKYPRHMSSSRSLALRAHDMCMCMCIRVRACMHRLRRSYICIASFYS